MRAVGCGLLLIAMLAAGPWVGEWARWAEGAPTMSDVEGDIQTMVSGNFTPDALGPERYDEIVKRSQTRPREYLRVLEGRYLGDQFDAVRLSNLYVAAALQVIGQRDAEAMRKVAQRFLKQYEATLLIFDEARPRASLLALLPEETGRMLQRLDARRAELRALIDRR